MKLTRKNHLYGMYTTMPSELFDQEWYQLCMSVARAYLERAPLQYHGLQLLMVPVISSPGCEHFFVKVF